MSNSPHSIALTKVRKPTNSILVKDPEVPKEEIEQQPVAHPAEQEEERVEVYSETDSWAFSACAD